MDSSSSNSLGWAHATSNHPSVNVGPHRYSWVELDKEKFDKEQSECIAKAVKQEECAAKEKHVRRTIIGTWQEHGCSMFWTVLGRMPLPSQAIMCWKAMMVVHKILREGHPNVVKDSYVYRKTLQDLHATYRFASGTYGKLCTYYLHVLDSKLKFHHKFPGVPGSLMFNEDAPIKIPDKDVNDVFSFAVQVLDYQDLLLNLEEEVFKTLQKGKNNSQIPSSQCRIAPLVPMIKECGGLYDILVHVMFKLHRSLPADTLEGHRARFVTQFKRLRLFFSEAGNLAFVTALTSVPSLPQSPPNFLIHGAFEAKPEKPKPIVKEPEPLIPKKDDRDLLIEQLMREINDLTEQLRIMEQMAKETENALRMQIGRLTEELQQYKKIAEEACDENTVLQSQLNAYRAEEDAKEKSKSNDEKFNKLKALYSGLRNEHVQLLRTNAEVKKSKDVVENEMKGLEVKMTELETKFSEKEAELQAEKTRATELEEVNKATRESLFSTEEEKNTEVASLQQELDVVNNKLKSSESSNKELEMELNKIREDMENQVRGLQGQMQQLEITRVEQEQARKSAEDTLLKLGEEKQNLENELAKELEDMKLKFQSEENTRQSLESQIASMTEENKKEVDHLKSEIDRMIQETAAKEKIREETEKKIVDITEENKRMIAELKDRSREDEKELKHKLLCTTVEECEYFIRDTLKQFDDPLFTYGSTCTAEYFKSRICLVPLIDGTIDAFKKYCADSEDVMTVVSNLSSLAYHTSETLLHGKATSHMASPEDCDALVSGCKAVGELTLDHLVAYKEREPNLQSMTASSNKLKEAIDSLTRFAEELIPKETDQLDGVETMVDEEINATAQLVADAAARIEEMLKKSRKEHSGIQLEVNERILDSCTELMKAIRELIIRSKDLQDEIVAEGKGTASAKDFYKRHHKWTEGLISAAKSVGWGASVLVDAADKVIQGKGKFEELVVASNEIAASTAQLVAASRVKASRDSERLSKVMSASKGVGNATATVVASVKSGAELTEEAKTNIDYTKLTLTQAKRLQMDSQVRMLELESALDKERTKLGRLRAAHYQLAAELYGLDEEEKSETSSG